MPSSQGSSFNGNGKQRVCRSPHCARSRCAGFGGWRGRAARTAKNCPPFRTSFSAALVGTQLMQPDSRRNSEQRIHSHRPSALVFRTPTPRCGGTSLALTRAEQWPQAVTAQSIPPSIPPSSTGAPPLPPQASGNTSGTASRRCTLSFDKWMVQPNPNLEPPRPHPSSPQTPHATCSPPHPRGAQLRNQVTTPSTSTAMAADPTGTLCQSQPRAPPTAAAQTADFKVFPLPQMRLLQVPRAQSLPLR